MVGVHDGIIINPEQSLFPLFSLPFPFPTPLRSFFSLFPPIHLVASPRSPSSQPRDAFPIPPAGIFTHNAQRAAHGGGSSGGEGREGEMSFENPPFPVPRLPTNELWGRPALLKPRGEKTSCNSDPPSLDAPIPQPPLRSRRRRRRRRRLRAAIWKMQPMSGEGEELVWEEDGLSGRPWSRERKRSDTEMWRGTLKYK